MNRDEATKMIPQADYPYLSLLLLIRTIHEHTNNFADTLGWQSRALTVDRMPERLVHQNDASPWSLFASRSTGPCNCQQCELEERILRSLDAATGH